MTERKIALAVVGALFGLIPMAYGWPLLGWLLSTAAILVAMRLPAVSSRLLAFSLAAFAIVFGFLLVGTDFLERLLDLGHFGL